MILNLVNNYLNKEFLKNYLKFIHLYSLYFIFFIISLTSIFFFLNITFEKFYFYKIFYILLTIAPLVFIRFSFNNINIINLIFYYLSYLFLIYLSCIFSIKFLELSPDGLSYQLKISYYLANGYNPFYDYCGSLIGNRNLEFIKYFSLPSASHQYTSHSIHFFENFFYNMSNEKSVDIFKAGKVLIALSTIFPILEILRIAEIRKLKYWITFIFILNPIIFNQFFNSYKDIYGYYFFIFIIYYFILLYTDTRFNKKNFYLFLISICIFSAPKMNFFFFGIIFFIIFSLILLNKFKIKSIFASIIILPIFILSIFSFTPTAKSFIYQEIFKKNINQQSLPPCYEKEFVMPFSPVNDKRNTFVKNTNALKLFTKSLFLKASKDDFENFDEKRANYLERLFTIKKAEMRYNIAIATPMLGAAGPLFGLAFIGSIILIILKKTSLKLKNIRDYNFEILSLIIFLVILIFPYPIFYRFFPFVWIIPILMMISLLAKNFNFYGSLIGIVLSINILIVSVCNILIIFPSQIIIREQIKFYYNNLEDGDDINIYLSNWESVIFSVDRITNNAISDKKIKVNKVGINDKDCKKKYLLFFTEAHLCLNENHEKKVKEYDKIYHKILPPYFFFKRLLNY